GERKLAVVGLDPARPLPVSGTAPRLLEEHRRAVGADDVEAGAGERDRMASVAARAVEDGRGRLDAGQPRGGEGLRGGVDAAVDLRVRAQVELVEEPVPVLVSHQPSRSRSAFSRSRFSRASRSARPRTIPPAKRRAPLSSRTSERSTRVPRSTGVSSNVAQARTGPA